MPMPLRRLAGIALIILLGAAPVPASAQPPEFGTISGRFIGHDGAGVAGVRVVANSLTSPARSVVIRTNRSGGFVLRPQPGGYRLSYQPPPPLLDQWGSGKESEWAADVLDVQADKEIVIEEKALPTGRIEGLLLDAAGEPAPGGVSIEDPSLGRSFQATADAQGRWFKTVWPGTYTVQFGTTDQVQWAYGKNSPQTADRVTVLADRTTVVDDKLSATGSLSVRAADARTGTPLTSFCVEAHTDYMFAFECASNGVAEFPKLGEGAYTVKVSDGVYLDSTTSGVRVSGGQTARFTAPMRQGATIEVTVTDAATGEPVGGICLNGQPADRPAEYGGYIGECADFSGRMTMTRVMPDGYVFFASVFDGAHGSQWVGPQGGVGARTQAAVVTASEGETTTMAVRLDGQGTIEGVVTDETTGQPVAGAYVAAGNIGGVAGSDGRYELPGLGPYDWVVFFDGQWSGGVASRFAATPIPVRPNETTRHDARLRQTATLSGRITGPAGQPPDYAEVTVVNAKSFDIMNNDPSIGPDGSFAVRLIGPQEVKLHIIASVGGRFVVMWYPDAPDFARGQAVSVPDGGEARVDIPITGG